MDAEEFVRREVLALTEKELQSLVHALAAARGWTHVYHTYSSRRSEPGFPDLVLVHPGQGRVVFAELKTMRGKLTPAQESWIAALETAQGDGTVRVCVWFPCCWLSGEIEAELR